MSIPSWARVGAKVVCVRRLVQRDELPVGEVLPVVGEVYTVAGVQAYAHGGVGIRLTEISNQPFAYLEGIDECSFDITVFRPVHTLESDITIHFAQFLHPKSPVGADA